jgi:hypothetical protein
MEAGAAAADEILHECICRQFEVLKEDMNDEEKYKFFT